MGTRKTPSEGGHVTITSSDETRAAADEDEQAESFSFGSMNLNPRARALLIQGVPLRISDRAFDLLTLLVTRAGEIVDKKSLFAAAWPDTFVEESNLRVQIAHLNKSLATDGDARLIQNIPGRGYRFAAPVRRISRSRQPHPEPSPTLAEAPRIFGRDDDLERLAALILKLKFITITGTGGIGKTTVALALLNRIRANYADGGFLIDVAPLGQPSLVAEHVASVLQVPTAEAQALEGVVRYLKERRALLVLDNCEHVLEATARIAETLASQAPYIHILATSREPMRARGEWVFPLGPLATPPLSNTMTAEEVMRYPSALLLRERAAAAGRSFDLDDADAPSIADVCIKLDGLPLALELAAVRIPSLGLKTVADRLDDRFDLLIKGRRTADHRHQTLSALIDWSYETLLEPSRKVWRRIAGFAGTFTLEDAVSIASLGSETNPWVLDALDDLVGKSLLMVEPVQGGAHHRFRLLETMRLYAYRRLVESGEESCIRRRLAVHLLERLESAGNDWDADEVRRWATHVPDIRRALEWGFAPSGDAAVAVKIIANSAPLWFKLLLASELRVHLERACAALPGCSEIDDLVRAKLHLALGHAIFHTRGPQAAVEETLRAGLAAAVRGHHVSQHLQILWSLYGNELVLGNYEGVQRNAREFYAVATSSGDPTSLLTAHRMASLGNHLSGRLKAALQEAKTALHSPLSDVTAAHSSGDFLYQLKLYDHEVASRTHLARTLWILGKPDDAFAESQTATERAQRIGQAFAIGYSLVCGTCPIAFWRGDLVSAQRYVQLLTEVTAGAGINVWRIGGRMFAKALDRLSGLSASIEADDELPLAAFYADTVSTLDPQLLDETAAVRAESGEVTWCTAEILRAKGERLLLEQGAVATPGAGVLFWRGYAIASAQGALAWQLRCAISLARVFAGSAMHAESLQILSNVYESFDQGLDTRDLRMAAALLGAA
jgi:predicted ATPase